MVNDKLHKIPEEVITYFSKSNIPLFHIIPIMFESKESLGFLLRDIVEQSSNLIKSIYEQEPQWVNDVRQWPSDQQKILTLTNLISDAIAMRRLSILTTNINEKDIKPYDHPDIQSINPSIDRLVNIDNFDYGSQYFPGLKRGNTVFEVLPSIANSENSMYWTLQYLIDLCKKCPICVRLDPLLIHPLADYRPIFFKMQLYGKPLNWEEIRKTKEEIHTQFQPDIGTRNDVEHTDLVWSPRDNEIHFICEEIPKPDMIRVRGSRYFHSIYIPTKNSFVHTDGGMRIFSQQEIDERINTHVRKIGKIGKRIKNFLVDGEISTTEWTNLMCAFFVWNNDIQNYFGVGINLTS
jgi:hypothetical protein